MSFKVRWSPRAKADIENHLNYLERNWGQKVTLSLLERIEEILQTISENPELYSFFEEKLSIHRCVVTSQIVLYYRVKEETVELITFWDTRQNPESLNI